MIRSTIFPGRYVQGYKAFNRIEKELSRFGDNAFMIMDPFVHDEMRNEIEGKFEGKIKYKKEKFEGECSDKEIQRLSKLAKENKANIIAGLGGGKTIDTAKAVAHELKLPVGIMPTIASTDAPCSALSVIYTEKGEFDRYLFLKTNPELVMIDTEVISKAPVRFIVAGMGDALATWFEAESCRAAYRGNMTGDTGSMAAYALARLCYETLIDYGALAKMSVERKTVTEAFEKVVEANTLLSGLGFESGGLGAAHAIHNGLTAAEETHEYNHGEKVAFGTLASLFLTDKPVELMQEVYDFCETVGLPTTLGGIGLAEAGDDTLFKIAETACKDGETIHNELIPVTPQAVVNAMKLADEYGKSGF
ncbi:MAG: glycerol dehydrogenase [Candidatus Kapaibacterium sp.]